MKTFKVDFGARTRATGILAIPSEAAGKQRSMMKRLSSAMGLLLLFAFGASAQSPSAILDYFSCYPTPWQPTVAQWADLSDQFDARDKLVDMVSDIKMVEFCNPAQVAVTSGGGGVGVNVILHHDAHLAMYQTSPGPTTINRSVTITNEFGTQNLITGAATILAVPSGMNPLSPNGGGSVPQIPPAAELDHFRCYTASGPAINKTVWLNDQSFVGASEVAVVLYPQLFCNPVNKSVFPLGGCPSGQVCALQNFPIGHPTAHMACYMISPKTPFDAAVVYNNQFVHPGTFPTAELTTPNLVCAPSTKSEDWRDI